MKWNIVLLVVFTSCTIEPTSEVKMIKGRNGDLARITLVNGQRNGPAHLHDLLRSVERSGNYKNGVKEGNWTFKKEGQLIHTMDFKKGLFHGKINSYGPNGSIAHQIEMVHGVREGREIYYFEDGDPRMIIEHHAGKRDGKFERWSRKDIELEGDHAVGEFCNDQKCGTWTKFFPNGETRWAVDMLNGKRNGAMNFWNSKGEATEVWIYEHDKLIEKRILE